MESNPKVSIIMPTYNRAAYIMESVESVLNQTYQNWELIIVDDGSEDDTEEIISQIKDARVQFYKAGKIGLGIKLKYIGIERSDGELIAFLDSDDVGGGKIRETNSSFTELSRCRILHNRRV
jgi:glycosyltransferase involved in cell wall biosynthesis